MISNFKPNVKGMGSFSIIYKWSALNEVKGYFGISHIIEHCMCERIKEIENNLLMDGILYNAQTSLKKVVFYIKGIDKNLSKYKKLLYDSVVNYEIPKEVFEREKQIVIQEISDNYSEQDECFFHNIFRKYFNTSLASGTLEDLKAITYENFIEYKNKYFALPDEICNNSKYSINEDEFKINDRDLKNRELSFNKDGYKNYELLEGPKVDDNRSLIRISSFSSSKEIDNFEKIIYYKLLAAYLSIGLTSPLYNELREKTGKVYSISMDLIGLDDSLFSVLISLKVSSKNLKEIKERMILCLETYLKKPSKTRYDQMIKFLKNMIKSNKLLNYFKINDDEELVKDLILNYKFNFAIFKKYCNEYLNEENVIVDDINIRN